MRKQKLKEELEMLVKKDEPKFVTLDQFLLKDLKNIDTRKQKFDSLRGYDPEGSYKNKEYLEWEEEKKT